MSEADDRRRLADAVRQSTSQRELDWGPDVGREILPPYHLDRGADIGPPRDAGPPKLDLIKAGRAAGGLLQKLWRRG